MKYRIRKEVPGNTKLCQCHFFLLFVWFVVFFPPPSFLEVPGALVCAPKSQRGFQLLVGWDEVEGLGYLVFLSVQMLR